MQKFKLIITFLMREFKFSNHVLDQEVQATNHVLDAEIQTQTIIHFSNEEIQTINHVLDQEVQTSDQIYFFANEPLVATVQSDSILLSDNISSLAEITPEEFRRLFQNTQWYNDNYDQIHNWMNGYDLAMQQEAQEASLTNDKITEILTSLNNQYSDMHYTTSNIWDMIYYYNLNLYLIFLYINFAIRN